MPQYFFIKYFIFAFYRISPDLMIGSQVSEVNTSWIWSFFRSYTIDLISISSFNNWLFGNWSLWFFSLTFLSLELSLLMVVGVCGFTDLTSILFSFFFSFFELFKIFSPLYIFLLRILLHIIFPYLLLCGQYKPYDQSYKFWRLKHVNCSLFRSFLKKKIYISSLNI